MLKVIRMFYSNALDSWKAKPFLISVPLEDEPQNSTKRVKINHLYFNFTTIHHQNSLANLSLNYVHYI